MNCKPGDLAIVIRDNLDIGALGKLVEVLYLAPPDKFQLPNGQWNVGSEDRYGQVNVSRGFRALAKIAARDERAFKRRVADAVAKRIKRSSK